MKKQSSQGTTQEDPCLAVDMDMFVDAGPEEAQAGPEKSRYSVGSEFTSTTHEWEKGMSRLQRRCYKILMSHRFEHVLGMVIFVNFVVVIKETDIGANDDPTPVWLTCTGWGLLGVFVMELVLKIYVLRKRFWCDKMNIFDFFVISIDLIMGVVGLVREDAVDVSALRILRLSRLARATKVFRVFPELQLMMAGLFGAVQAILWGALLIMFVLIMWSILAVQFIHPINKKVAQDGYWQRYYAGCERCKYAYSSVFEAALTFFTAIVAGDSWGRETIPVIEYEWNKDSSIVAPVFFGIVFVTIGLAILNLILGVVVNVATEARDGMKRQLEEEKVMARLESQNNLLKMCRDMDRDGNDELTKEELHQGYRSNADFRQTLKLLDIGEDDLEIVWSIMDTDRSGTVTSKEFVSQVYKMKSSDSQFMLAYIKYYITEIKDNLRIHLDHIKTHMDRDMTKIETEVQSLSVQIERSNQSTPLRGLTRENSRDLPVASPLLPEQLAFDGMSPIPSKEIVRGAPRSISPYFDPDIQSVDMLLESALLLAQLQAAWQQCLTPLNEMQSQHVKLVRELKTIAPTEGPREVLSDVINAWQQGLSVIDDMRDHHAKLSNKLASIVPITQTPDVVNRLQSVWQQCLASIGDMQGQHSKMSRQIETLIQKVNASMEDKFHSASI